MKQYIKSATSAWNVLNGVFIVYKPAGIHFLNVKDTIIQNICRDLNDMEARPFLKYVEIHGPTNKEMNVTIRNSYADNPLVVGPRYIVDDFKLTAANVMCQESSGILVCGVNSGRKLIQKLKQAKLTKFYKLKGILGQARDNNFSTGSITEKSMWKGIKRHHIDRICATMQAAHQKQMFELCGLDIQSQAAYDLAIKGPIRPADPKVPMLYTVKCTDFKPPEFTLEIVCIHENDVYLKALVAELGVKLHSTAHCSYIQCSQYGHFNIKDALLSKYWTVNHILNNIQICNNIFSKYPYMLKQEHAHLVEEATSQQLDMKN